MLIAAATGFVSIPVSYDPDKLEARFILADGENRFQVVAAGTAAYETIRTTERTGERVFVAGMGASRYASGKKAFIFELQASLVVPVEMVHRHDAELMVQQMLVSRIMGMVENGGVRNGKAA